MNVDEYIRYEIDKFERLVVGRKLEPEEVAIETDMAASMFAQRVADHNTASAEEHEEGEKIKFVVKEDDKEPETIELINNDALYRIGLLVPHHYGRKDVEGVETFYNVTAKDIQNLLQRREGSSLYYVVDM